MNPSNEYIAQFKSDLWDYYHAHGRDLPWRIPALPLGPNNILNPYAILVSEIMLQQTQVSRVVPKFEQFMQLFPSVKALASAEQSAVLQAWSGLGYNRRAKFLHQAAKVLVASHDGELPASAVALKALPGIGVNTAGAILTYGFNYPVPFIETNVRTVYIHYFLADTASKVQDRDILTLINQTIDSENPREFYWAIMDYGSFLKKSIGNVSRASHTYKKQSVFAGSQRQVRGQVIKMLLESGPMDKHAIAKNIVDIRLAAVLDSLVSEGLVRIKNERYSV